MRKKLLAAVLAVAVVLAAGCRKKDTSSGDSRIVIWGDEKAAEVPVTEMSEKEATEAVHEEDLATKKEEQAEPEKGKKIPVSSSCMRNGGNAPARNRAACKSGGTGRGYFERTVRGRLKDDHCGRKGSYIDG